MKLARPSIGSGEHAGHVNQYGISVRRDRRRSVEESNRVKRAVDVSELERTDGQLRAVCGPRESVDRHWTIGECIGAMQIERVPPSRSQVENDDGGRDRARLGGAQRRNFEVCKLVVVAAHGWVRSSRDHDCGPATVEWYPEDGRHELRVPPCSAGDGDIGVSSIRRNGHLAVRLGRFERRGVPGRQRDGPEYSTRRR